MEIKKLLSGIKVGNCETCKNENCNGKLNYDSLCSNVNYLKEYGEQNYEKNRETFKELKKIMGEQKPAIFSFGCGVGFDYIGATENFGSKVIYYPIDECRWAIMDTENYKNFEPKLPKRIIKFNDGIMLLSMTPNNAVLCFFNSLFTISQNTDLKNKLLLALKSKNNFYFVCDFTVNNNFHLPTVEQDFIYDLLKALKIKFTFKKFDILDGKGIIILGNKR